MLLPSIVVSYESNTAHRIILSESKSSQTTSDNRLFVSTTPTKPNKLMQLRHARIQLKVVFFTSWNDPNVELESYAESNAALVLHLFSTS